MSTTHYETPTGSITWSDDYEGASIEDKTLVGLLERILVEVKEMTRRPDSDTPAECAEDEIHIIIEGGRVINKWDKDKEEMYKQFSYGATIYY